MIKRLSLLAAVLVAALAACAGAASAQTANCVGVLLPGTYANVDVPANARCTLPSIGTVTVSGNVTVQSGAQLDRPPGQVNSTFVVNGSLIAVHAASFELDNVGVTVDILGSTHLAGTTSAVDLRGLSICGTLTIRDSTAAFFAPFFSTVGGSVLVRDNTTSGSFHFIGDNTIGAGSGWH